MLRISGDEVCEIWTIDRPEAANAINAATVEAFAGALDDLERRLAQGGGPRGLVIASSPRPPGSRAVYLSGADLSELGTLTSAEQARAFSHRMTELLQQIEALPLLVVAAISGDVYGGGCELITACDLRVAERGVSFSFRQARMGLSTGWGGSTRLVHLVGLGAAKRLLLTGLPCDADEALRIGLCDELVDSDTSLDRATAIVAASAEGARGAVARLKAGLHDAIRLDRRESYERELDRFVESWSSDEHRTALAALSSRRK
jgi:enoyl-CoA hydratase/carnithine racemase